MHVNTWLIIVLCYVLLAVVSFWGLCCFDEPLVLDEKQAEAIAAKRTRGQIRGQPRWASILLSLIGIPLACLLFLLSPLIFLPLLIYWLFDKKRGENVP